MAHRPIHTQVRKVEICLIMDAMIDQHFKDLVTVLELIPTKELLPFHLHHCPPEEVPQVTVSRCLLIPSSALKVHSIIDGCCNRVQPGYNTNTGTSKGASDVAGDGVARSPVFVIKGGKMVGHVSSGSWLSVKVDSKLLGPIPNLYTIDILLLPSTADWTHLSWSSNSPLGWSSPYGTPMELHLVIYVFLHYLLTCKRYHSLPYHMTS